MRLLLAGFFTLVLAAPASAADITVTTRLDTMSNDGRCSLREAVTAANTNAPSSGCPAGGAERDVIVLGDGHYLLSRAGAGESGNLTGDLDVNGPVTLRGVGRGRTVVSAEGLDRVVDVLTDDVTIADLTITGGAAPDGADGPSGTNPGQPGEPGGGIRSAGRLELRDVTVRGNRAGSGGAGGSTVTIGMPGGAGGRGGEGGGIYSTATLTLTRTRVVDNQAGAAGPGGSAFVGADAEQPGGDGGGIAAFGLTTVDQSVIEANRAGTGGNGGGGNIAGGNASAAGDGGGILVTGPAVIMSSTIAGNSAGSGGRGAGAVSNGGNGGRGGHGGGLYAIGTVSVTGTLFAGNTTGEGGGGGDGPTGNAGDGGAGGDGAGLMGFTGVDLKVQSSTFVGGTAGAGGPGGAGPFGNNAPAGSATAAYAVGTVTFARTLTDGTCNGGGQTDGGGNLGTDFSCPVTLASLFLDANGMPGPGSHAIDSASGCPAIDLAGTARPQGAGCDVGALEVPAAALAVARTGLEFGSVTTGAAVTRSVDLSNPGLPSLPLTISVTGDPAFTLDGQTCGAALGGGGGCAVTVRFAPTTTGARTGSLQIGGETVALTGTGVAPPTDPAPVDPQDNPPQATARCVVPRLKGKTVVAAARSLQNANCKLGKVTRRGRGRPGRVRSFSPKAGTSLPAGATVRLVVNRRR